MENEPSLTANLVLNFVLLIPMILVVYGFSKRRSGNTLAPVLLTCIPVFGFIYFYYYCYKTVADLLDTINSLKDDQAANSTNS
jgi:hypothetical protein